MLISCCIICALLVNICIADIVFSQVTVEGAFGGSVLLPCVSSKIEHNLQDISVLWRHNSSKNVFAVIKGRGSVEDQDPKYKNRVKTFPKEYEKGNFSIIIYNLTHTDAGEHQCYITHSPELVKVQLLVNETEENQSTAEKGGNAKETKQIWIQILIPVICVLLGIFLYIVYKITKMAHKTSSSEVSAHSSEGLLRLR